MKTAKKHHTDATLTMGDTEQSCGNTALEAIVKRASGFLSNVPNLKRNHA